jgi:starch phosphorylase
MARLTPLFSASRTVREYTERHYLPAAAAYRSRAAEGGAAGKQLVAWQRRLAAGWPALGFGEVRVTSTAAGHRFEVELALGELPPAALRVELCAEVREGLTTTEMQPTPPTQGGGGTALRTYVATIPATRPASDYTARVIPSAEGAAIPLEAAQILWQR